MAMRDWAVGEGDASSRHEFDGVMYMPTDGALQA